MNKNGKLLVKVGLAVGLLFIAANIAYSAGEDKKLVKYPEGYRDWTHVKSMVIQQGHSLYDSFGGIHHIYANDKALKAMKGGKPYPDGSVLVFDLLEAKSDGSALVEGPRKVVGVMQKNAKRFAQTGGWGYEGFKGDTQQRVVTDPVAGCFQCHVPLKAKDYVHSEYRK